METSEARVSTLELFFDLVFVFAITQVTGVVGHEPTAAALGRGVLVFAVLWWAWGAYAWLTNTVPTGETLARVVVLGSSAAALVTALAVPSAWGDGGTAFALGYLVVMLLHLALFALAGENPERTRRAIARLAPTNIASALVLLVAAQTEGTAQAVLWLVAVATSYAGPYVTGVAGFTVHPGHFVERHGLIVIIALGESIVAVGALDDDITVDAALAGTALVVMLLVASLWWDYFTRDAGAGERALLAVDGHARAALARDVYSYLHVPLVLGIVLTAVGIHEVLVHRGEPLDPVVAAEFCGGVALYFAGLAAIRARRGDRPGAWCVAAVLVAAAMAPLATEVDAVVTAAVLAVLALGVAASSSRHRPRRSAEVAA